ncbi:hypothetical protein FXF51_01610 [Nonomuraea sp. PA05]|uniref:hypothetical protein n=1 Tax=Nonomuraea sp. PA05 TaxID=2604466 RepID=UPI0011D8F188|nr:hypothetical protein [Nonomuraea sp. PA05]TYB71158.1 hypothetical protein FXF51_01610 [Nonomuraea sp. PA05]
MTREEDQNPLQLTFLEPDALSQLAGSRTATPHPAPERRRAATWMNLINTGTRLDAVTNERLTHVCKATGQGLQDVWEAAINFYCDQFYPPIPKEMPDETDLDIPRFTRRTHAWNEDGDEGTLVTARLKQNTRARLVEACHRMRENGNVVITDALNAWFNHLDKGGRP